MGRGGTLRHWLRWWLVALGVITGGVVALVTARATAPIYQAQTTLLINTTLPGKPATLSDLLMSEQLAFTYSALAVSTPVLQEAIRDGHLPFTVAQLKQQLHAAAVSGQPLFVITGTAPTGPLAQQVAMDVARAFITQEPALTGVPRPGLVKVVAPAATPRTPLAPHIRFDTVLGAVAGGMAAVTVIAIALYFQETITRKEQLEELLDLPLLGSIPRQRGQAVRQWALHWSSAPPVVREAFQFLRAALDQARAQTEAKVILVTSAAEGEGKTATAIGLALAYASAGQRVVLVDADLQRPRLHELFGLHNTGGLTRLLIDQQTAISQELQEIAGTPLVVVTAGSTPKSLPVIWRGPQVATALQQLRTASDVVILDAPPVLAIADVVMLASHCDGILFVVERGRMRLSLLREALQRLRQSGALLLGAVLAKSTGAEVSLSKNRWTALQALPGGMRRR